MSRLNIIHHKRSDRDPDFQEHVMTARRTFLSAAAAFTPLFAQGQSASGAAAVEAGASGRRALPTNAPSTSGHYRPPHCIGMGGVPLGNGFKPPTDA
jgi:D-threo-aldose 1-dehydrogenase